MLDTGEELQVPVIDLHKESMEFILRTGLETAKAWFYPADYTHSNDFGAFRAAKVVADELKEICPELLRIRRQAQAAVRRTTAGSRREALYFRSARNG